LSISTDKKIGTVLLCSGALGLALSIIYGSTALVFIGLTFSFWGFLFLLVLPGKYVKSEVMDYMSSSSLYAVDQIIANLRLQGKAIYIPVPREAYLPYYIGVKNEFVYIPKRNVKIETAIGQAFMKNLKGLRLAPPGLSLANVMEKKSKLNFHDLDLSYLAEVLPSLITQEVDLAENFTISLEGNEVSAEIRKPTCEDLCKEASKMQHICPHIGCPLTSSIACILTRVANKPVIIERCSLKDDTITTFFRIL